MKSRYKGIMFIVCSAFCFAVESVCQAVGISSSIRKTFLESGGIFFALILMKQDHVGFSGEGESVAVDSEFHVRTIGILMAILCGGSSGAGRRLHALIRCRRFCDSVQLSDFEGGVKAGSGSHRGRRICRKPLYHQTVSSQHGACTGSDRAAGRHECGSRLYPLCGSLGIRGEKGPFIVCFFSGFSCLVTLPYLWCGSMDTWAQLGFCCWQALRAAGGHVCDYRGVLPCPGQEISVYDYSQIIFFRHTGLCYSARYRTGSACWGM